MSVSSQITNVKQQEKRSTYFITFSFTCAIQVIDEIIHTLAMNTLSTRIA